jgi:hypothetical protein
MKRTLLSLAIAASFAAYAQPNLSVVLTSPTGGSTITAGAQFSFDVTINNTGSTGHLGFPADTVIYFPLFNGSFLNGANGPVAWYMGDPIAAAGNVTRQQTLAIQGGASGTLEICAGILNFGSSYTGDQLDTSNTCANVTYNAMSIGDLRMQETFDNSYHYNGTYYVQVSSRINLLNPVMEIVDLSGRTIKHIALNADGGEINETVSMEDLVGGIYIVRLSTDTGLISTNKVSVQ